MAADRKPQAYSSPSILLMLAHITLPTHNISKAQGEIMPTAETLTNVEPLHGDWVYGVKVHGGGGKRTLTKRWYAMEFGQRERVRTQRDENHAGIGIIELFEAPASHKLEGRPAISLEEAMAYNPHAQRFLFSTAASGLAVVSSRIGYDESGAVEVLPPHPYVNPKLDTQVDLYDYTRDTSDADLSRQHIARLVELGGNPDTELAQSVIDATFRYIVSCSPERR